jgi:hypothetical protein
VSPEADNLVAALLALFEAQTGVDLARDETAMKRIREAADKAHHEWLVLKSSFEVNLPFLATNGPGAFHLHVMFSAADARRAFAGEELSKMMAEARAERASTERALEATRLEERTKEESEAAYRAQTWKIYLVVMMIVVAFFVSIIAIAFTRHHEAEAEPRDRTHERSH